jgi:hypothetical protein
MGSICNTTSCWALLALVLVGIVGQVGLVWWAHLRAAKRINDAKRQTRKEQASLIEKEFDKMKGSE